MKYILDSSAILDEPEILAASKSRNLLIPQAVQDELIFQDMSHSRKNISKLIDQAIELGATIVEDTRSSSSHMDRNDPDIPRLSGSDIEVVKLAIAESKKLGKDTVTVVTMNKSMGKYLSQQGIRWLEPDHFFKELECDPFDQDTLTLARLFSRNQFFPLE